MADMEEISKPNKPPPMTEMAAMRYIFPQAMIGIRGFEQEVRVEGGEEGGIVQATEEEQLGM